MITDVRNRIQFCGVSVFDRNNFGIGRMDWAIERYLSSDAVVVAISKNDDNDNNEQGQYYTKTVKRVAKERSNV